MVLTLTLAYALSKVLVVTWFFPTGLGLDQEGKRRLDVVCLPLECPLPAGFLVLFQHITYAQPSVSRMPGQGAEGSRLGMFKKAVCSRLPGSAWGIFKFKIWLWSPKEHSVGCF